MKKTNAKLILLALGSSLLFTACYKKFDTSSYQPPLDIGGYSSSDEVAAANLVAYWGFNGDYIESKSGAAGDNTGTTFSVGVKGQAMQGALNSYVTQTPPASVAGVHSFSITYWVNSPAPSSGIIGMVNLAKTDGFWGNIDMFFENGSSSTNGKFRAHITNGPVDAWVAKDGLPNLFDRWIHVGLTYDETSSTFTLYINGNSVATTTAAGFGPINFTNIGKLVFGCVQFQTNPSQTSSTGSQPWASYLTGRMDEIRIYNKALSGAEVSALSLLEGRGK